MSRYILNSAVMTSFGLYVYSPLSIENAQKWIDSGAYLSTVRYPETAEALGALVERPIPCNDGIIKMQPFDQALVFRLVFPEGTKRIPTDQKGKLDVDFILKHHELGLLKMFD